MCTLGQATCTGSSLAHCVDVNGCLEWDAGTACPTGASCVAGACAEPPVTFSQSTELCGVHRYAGAFSVVGGAVVSCSTGDLTIYATDILVDPASSVVMSPASTNGLGAPPSCSFSGGCSSPQSIASKPGGGGYGTAGTPGGTNNGEIYNCYLGGFGCTCVPGYQGTCAGQPGGTPWGNPFDMSVDMGQAGGANPGCTGGKGGGALRLVGESSVTIQGVLEANGQDAANAANCANEEGGGSGGAIVVAAPSVDLTMSASVLVAGGKGQNATQGAGGAGRVKILHGDTYTNAATIDTTAQSLSYLPPVSFTSSTHPDETLFYNDRFTTLDVAWSKPYAGVAGYWYALGNSPDEVLTATNGTFTLTPNVTLPASQLTGGSPYFFYVTSLDGATTKAGTVANHYTININSVPHTVASTTHPDPNTWYTAPADLMEAAFSWSPPAGVPAASFVGYWYRIDHASDSIYDPASPAGWTYTQNTSLIATQDANGMPFAAGTYYFHVVASDTVGNPTLAAASYRLQLGAAPATMSFFGYVADTNMTKVQGATVTMQPYGLETTTDSNGYFIFNGVYEEGYTLRVHHAGYADAVTSVTVAPNVVPYDVTLSP